MAMMQLIRKHVERLYTGRCDVWEYQEKKDHGITQFEETLVMEGLPCRLSFPAAKAAYDSNVYDSIVQETLLLISPDIIIAPGSKLIVTQNGVTTAYQNSGQPAVYETHQEIGLKLFRGWA